MPQPEPLTDIEYDHFIVYRVRMREYMHLVSLWDYLGKNPSNIPSGPGLAVEDIRATLYTAAFGWLASLIDTSGDSLNVFNLWSRFFPSRSADIKAVKKVLLPLLPKLKLFRNHVAFHANLTVANQLAASAGIHDAALAKATGSFLKLALSLMGEERQYPVLVERLEHLGL